LHHIPNIISVLRVILVLPIAIQLYNEAWSSAFVLIFIAGISDAIDGFLARAFKWQSKLGSFLDPLADKLLLGVIFISLAYKGVIPVWLVVLVIARDTLILMGAGFYQWITQELTMSPLFISKINTALQIIFVLAMMYHLAIATLPQQSIFVLQIAVAVTTLLSGILYVKYWIEYTMLYFADKKNNQK